MKRLLAIDGGGIRGIIPAIVCKEIERLSGRRISDLFDLIAGTSTGALIAMGLAYPPNGKSAADIVDFYKSEGEKIFSEPRRLRRYVTGPKYNNIELRRAIDKFFQNCRICDAVIELLIPTYDIRLRRPFYISRRE